MKRLTIAVMALVAVGMATAVAGDKPEKPVVEEKVMVVSGTKDWTDTGFTLRPGDHVTVKGSGKVCFNTIQPESCVGPNGWLRANYKDDWRGDYGYCLDPYETAGHAALIGGIENNNFTVGTKASFTGKDGRLYLGINDCTLTEGQFANSGKYSAVITVERARVPKP